MQNKLQSYWLKTKGLRNSMPNFFTDNVFGPLEDEDPTKPKKSLSEQINDRLMKYKEFKAVYKKTGIRPVYFMYVLIICLLFIVIGFFDKYLTILIATVYPLYISLKTLQYKIGEEKQDGGVYSEQDKKKDVTQWLSYWVVYAFFINFEGLFGYFLKYIPFYFFIKVIFLLFCFLPQYQLAWWIYDNCIRKLFQKYETHIINFSNRIYKSITVGDQEKESEGISQEKVTKAIFETFKMASNISSGGNQDNGMVEKNKPNLRYSNTDLQDENSNQKKNISREVNPENNDKENRSEEKLDDSAIFEQDDTERKEEDVKLDDEDNVNLTANN